MRKSFAILLLMVFATTALPIGQVGRLLASNQLNEEVCQQANQLLEEKSQDCPFDACCPPHGFIVRFELSAKMVNPKLQQQEEIPSSPTSDILMPPPKGITA